LKKGAIRVGIAQPYFSKKKEANALLEFLVVQQYLFADLESGRN
jgi:hypothetical protein